MNPTRTTEVLSLLRNILTMVGGYLLGRSVFGVEVTHEVWQVIVGSLFTLIGIGMSIADKTVTVEKVQGAVRHIVSTLGGVLVGSGVIAPDKLELYAGIVLALIPIIMGYLSRKKVSQVESGHISVQQLKGSGAVNSNVS